MPTLFADKLPPQDLDAEQAVLGTILIDASRFDEVARVLKPEHFHGEACRMLFATIVKMRAEELPLDSVLIAQRLKADGSFEKLGGVLFLNQTMESVGHAANATYYAKLVFEKYILRQASYACTESLRAIYDDTASEPSNVIERLLNSALKLAEQEAVIHERTDFKLTMTETLDAISSRKGGQSVGLQTGLVELDNLIGGLKGGQLIILGARPSVGKTSLLINIVDHVRKQGGHQLFVSLEQSRHELCERMLAMRSRIDSHRLQTGKINEHERQAIIDAAASIADNRLIIEDDGGLNVTQIEAQARLHARKHDIGLIVVDYLQLVTPADVRAPREIQVAAIGRTFKRLARSLNVPLLCACQLNRQVEREANKRPRLSHLRESGSLEQDADVVLLLHRPDAIEADNRPNEVELNVAKNRNGRTGLVNLVWDGPTMTFHSAAPSWEHFTGDDRSS